MDMLEASLSRGLFIPANIESLLGSDSGIASSYLAAYLSSDTNTLNMIERDIGEKMHELHSNSWDDYIVMLAHYIFRERQADIAGSLIKNWLIFNQSKSNPLLKQVPNSRSMFRVDHLEYIITNYYSCIQKKRIIGIDEVITIVASQS